MQFKTTGATRVFGIAGDPVEHSKSPLMHNEAFRLTKTDAVYVPIHLTETGPFLKKALLAMNIGGLSVTIPHKIFAAKIADESDELSSLCGAANTLIFKNGRVHALNTDGPGAVMAIKQNGIRISGKTIIIYGYGGSARAIAGALAIDKSAGRIIITGRNPAKAKKLISDIQKHTGFERISFVAGREITEPAHLLIQTTPAGMQSAEKNSPQLPDDLKHILAFTDAVFDIVYIPKKTPLIKEALKLKKKVIYGYEMLLYQAVLQFEAFTESIGQKKKAPADAMKKVVLKGL